MSQKWFQSKCIKQYILSILAISMHLTTDVYAKILPKGLKEIADKYSRSNTLSANFKQINENATTHVKKESFGNLFIEHPSKMRWETKGPEESLLVSDGKYYWYYTPPFEDGERGQVIETKKGEIQSQFAGTLLSGDFSNQNLKIEKKTNTLFILTPKKGTSGTVLKTTLEIDPKKKCIHKIILEYKNGNKTQIMLSEIVLGKKLSPTLFQFTPPPQTDRITSQEDGD